MPAASRTRPPTRDFLYQHTSYEPDIVDSYRMIFSEASWSYLNQRPVMSNDLVPASFVFNDSEIYHNVGIRFGNSPWTRPSYNPTNASYRPKFGDDDRFHGWKKFKIDNQRNENYMDERVAMYLFQSNASSAPYTSPPYLENLYCQPYANNRRLAHVYDHVEVPGPAFLDRWYPGDSNGTLMKMDDRFEVSDLGQRSSSVEGRVQYPPQGGGDGSDKEEYRWYFFHRTRDKYDDFSELMDLAYLLDSRRTRTDEFNATLFDEVNVEEFIRCWSVIFNIDDWDTWGTTRGKNCYLYRPRLDGRWIYVPWDKDLIFGSLTNLPVIPQNHREAVRLSQSPNGRRVFGNVVEDMLDTFWTREHIALYFQEVVEALPRASIGTYARGAAFVTGRATTMRSLIAGGARATFEITAPADADVRQDEGTIALEGDAPYGVWHLSLVHDGETTVLEVPDDLDWTQTRWTTREIALRPGENRLTVLGFSGDGASILGQDSVTVIVEGAGETFLRGDADGDGVINLNDVLFTANYLFLEGPAPSCFDRMDADDSGRLDLTDALVLANYLFLEGPLPAAPFPEPGVDPTPDGLPACP